MTITAQQALAEAAQMLTDHTIGTHLECWRHIDDGKADRVTRHSISVQPGIDGSDCQIFYGLSFSHCIAQIDMALQD